MGAASTGQASSGPVVMVAGPRESMETATSHILAALKGKGETLRVTHRKRKKITLFLQELVQEGLVA